MRKPQDDVTALCVHPDLEYLGDNRGVRFLRCENCAAVFVLHGGEAWRLPPTEESTTRKESQH